MDNASTEKVKETFIRKYPYVEILALEDNNGFSKANNMGYRHLRKRNLDFIFICNSDIEFYQKDFLDKLLELHEKTNFHICGPDVYAPNMKHMYYHGHQSPAYPWEYSAWYTKYNMLNQNLALSKVEERYRILKKVYCLVIRCMCKFLANTIYLFWRKNNHIHTAVHGSCIILSSKFISAENNLFEPETFFYYEELLLYLRAKKKGYISIYSPNIKIKHLQGISTEKRSKSEESNDWIKRNMIESARIYLNELESIKNMCR